MEEKFNEELMETTVLEEVTEEEHDYYAEGKKVFSAVGLRYFFFALIATVLQLVYSNFISLFVGAAGMQESWVKFSIIIIPMYVISFPILILMLKNIKVQAPVKNSLSFGGFVKYVFYAAGLVGVFNIVGSMVESGLANILNYDINQANALAELIMDSDAFWRILTVGILAPIVEEFIFRKLLIDRVLPYGEFMAIVMSGLMFGLFHGNFAQFFYATALGMLFAYVYVRTGKIWYTIILHMLVNLSTSVVSVYLISQIDMDLLDELTADINALINMTPEFQSKFEELLPALTMFGFWIIFLFIMSVTGIIMILVNIKKAHVEKQPKEIKKRVRVKAAVFNLGTLIYIFMWIIMFVYYYASLVMVSRML